MSQIEAILKFWFDDPNAITTGGYRKVWFSKDPDFDRTIQTQFLTDYQQAAIWQLDHWQATPTGCLALILLLDQFSRNLFRGQPQSFATDAKALMIAEQAIAQEFDQALPLIQRWFVYLPFMHSEDLAMQQRSVQLFTPFQDNPVTQSAYTYALKHLEVIERFGRFPHRNAILGRETTPEEAKFLTQPGSSF
ncbi:MAG TPA: DUF924 family protein [Microcoleaceae cyanobacterium]|jgi:uncharacterized protein (DUF924 family)